MKDTVLGKIIYYLFLVLVLLISVWLFVFSIGVIPLSEINSYIAFYYDGNWLVNLITALIAVFLFVVCIKLMFPGQKKRTFSGALVKNTELGVILVSIGTLNNIAQKAVRKFDVVKDVKSNIISEMDGITIQLKLMIMPDVIIPDITKKIQDEVKEYVEGVSGINVKEVQIFIDDLTHPQRSRVE